MHAEQSELTGLAHQPKIKIAAFIPIGNVRPHAPLHPVPDSRLDVAFIVGQKMINPKQFERSSTAHQFSLHLFLAPSLPCCERRYRAPAC